MPSLKLGERIRYGFDNTLSRGPLALLVWLALLVAFVIIVISILVWVAGIGGNDSLIEQAQSGLQFLLRRRRRDDSGLLRVVHPWETGCDDSPRWDDFCPGTSFNIERWRRFKVDVLSTIDRGPDGEPLDNPAFAAAPVSFSALTAWNALELASATGDTSLVAEANALGEAVDARFDPERATWVDGGSAVNGSGRIRTSDAALGLLGYGGFNGFVIAFGA